MGSHEDVIEPLGTTPAPQSTRDMARDNEEREKPQNHVSSLISNSDSIYYSSCRIEFSLSNDPSSRRLLSVGNSAVAETTIQTTIEYDHRYH